MYHEILFEITNNIFFLSFRQISLSFIQPLMFQFIYSNCLSVNTITGCLHKSVFLFLTFWSSWSNCHYRKKLIFTYYSKIFIQNFLINFLNHYPRYYIFYFFNYTILNKLSYLHFLFYYICKFLVYYIYKFLFWSKMHFCISID